MQKSLNKVCNLVIFLYKNHVANYSHMELNASLKDCRRRFPSHYIDHRNYRTNVTPIRVNFNYNIYGPLFETAITTTLLMPVTQKDQALSLWLWHSLTPAYSHSNIDFANCQSSHCLYFTTSASIYLSSTLCCPIPSPTLPTISNRLVRLP